MASVTTPKMKGRELNRDRLTTTTATRSSDGARVGYTYVYDEPGVAGGLGRLTSVLEPERTIRFTYTAAGRLWTETITETGITTSLVTKYAYDGDGDLVWIEYPSGHAVSYGLDPATKRPVGVWGYSYVSGTWQLDTTYASAITHVPAGPLRSLTYGNSLPLSQGFNRRYEPSTISSGPLALTYGVSLAGDVTTIAEGNASRTLMYDFLDRVTGYSLLPGEPQGSSSTYTYDWDNLLEGKVPYGGVTQRKYHFAYDSQTNTKEIWVYDPPGSVNPSFIVCLEHDPLGRLVKVSRSNPPYIWYCATNAGGTELAKFKYDHRGRRIARWLASTNDWTYFLHDPGGSLLSELKKPAAAADPWSRQRDYVWLDGRPLAQVETPAPGSAFTYYYHVDHIGLPRALTNQSGQTVWSASAPPYGDIVETTTTDPLSGRTVVTNLRLPGQYDDRLFQAAGIDMKGPYYNWNRWYLPGVGRYLELDPIALAGGFNGVGWYAPDWYNYAGGDPLRNIDPDGRFWAPPPPPWWAPVIPWIGRVVPLLPLLWPNRTGGDPCESTPGGCTPQPQPPPDQCSPIRPPKYTKKCEAHFDNCWPILGMNQCRDCVARCIGNGGNWPFGQPECNYGQ